MYWRYILILLFSGSSAFAEVLVPVRTIRAKETIGPADVTYKSVDVAGAVSDLSEIVGKEARVALYPGRPVQHGDVGPPAIIERNDLVVLVFSQGRLRIMAEGRSLGRGAAGELIRVMNITSRTTISGRIQPDGSIEVQ